MALSLVLPGGGHTSVGVREPSTVVLTGADLPGFTLDADQSSDGFGPHNRNDSAKALSQCTGSDPLLSELPSGSNVQVGLTYAKGANGFGGPTEAVASIAFGASSSGSAARAYEDLKGAFVACFSAAFDRTARQDGVTPVQPSSVYTLAPPYVGDQSAALRVLSTVSIGGSTISVYQDFVIIRTGPLLSILWVEQLPVTAAGFIPPSEAFEHRLAETLSERMGTAPGFPAVPTTACPIPASPRSGPPPGFGLPNQAPIPATLQIPSFVPRPPGSDLYATSYYGGTDVITNATLAPHGFMCQATQAGGGPVIATLTDPSNPRQRIFAGYDPVPPGSTADFACPFISPAREELRRRLANYSKSSSCALPSADVVTLLPTGSSSLFVAAVRIPPGTAWPQSFDAHFSTTNSTVALITWDSKGNSGLGSTQGIACALRTDQYQTCAAALAYFLATSDVGLKLSDTNLLDAVHGLPGFVAGQGSPSVPSSPYRPPVPPGVDCTTSSYTFSAGGSATVLSVQLGEDFEEELSLDSGDTWTVDRVQGFNGGVVGSLGGHVSLGGKGSRKLGWDLGFSASLGYEQGLTAQFSSGKGAVDAYLSLGPYDLEHSGPWGFVFGGLPDAFSSGLTSEYSALGVIADASGSLGLVGGDASLAGFAGEERDIHTGETTLVFTVKPSVALPLFGLDSDFELKIHENAQQQPTAVELDAETQVSNGFTFSTSELLKQIKNAEVGASGYSTSSDVTSTQIVLDLTRPGNLDIAIQLLSDIEQGDRGAAERDWKEFYRRAIVFSFLDHVTSDSTGADVSGGEALTFGGAVDTSGEKAELRFASFQLPFETKSRPWKECDAAAYLVNRFGPR